MTMTPTIDIDTIFKIAVEKQASDIILTAGAPPTLRIHSQLRTISKTSLTSEMTKNMLLPLLREDQRKRFETERELDFSLQKENNRFRANLYYQRGSIGGVFRLITAKVPSIEELNLPHQIYDFAMQRQGLFLVTGPTGSGKSTTLASMIDIINTNKKLHIITIEDPIEFLHSNKSSIVDQREVGDDTKGFASALKHVLRQDPDVIMIGELRDYETAATALTAAETGHLVMATLHTNDSVQTIDRLIDIFPSHQHPQVRNQLSMCLNAIVSQRLIPKVDKSGLIVAVEILINNPAIQNLIREGKTHQIYGVIDTHSRQGMISLDTSITLLYKKGIISFEDASERMKNPSKLRA